MRRGTERRTGAVAHAVLRDFLLVTLLWVSMSGNVRSQNADMATVEGVKEIEAVIQAGTAEGKHLAYQRAALEIIRLFGRVAQDKKEAGLDAESQEDLRFLKALAARTLKDAQAIKNGRLFDPVIPNPRLRKVRITNGNLVADGSPVILLGPMGYNQLRDQLSSVPLLGFNSIGDDFDNYAAFNILRAPGEIDRTAITRLVESWTRLDQLNLAAAFNPTLHYFPVWALKNYPDITGGDPVDRLPDWSGQGRDKGFRTKNYGSFFPFAIDSSSLRRLVGEYYRALSPAITTTPGFRVIWLMNEPAYRSKDLTHVQLYRDVLRKKFGNVAKLNQAWGSTYADFGDITPAERENDAGRFDWLAFNQEQLAAWFAWLASEMKKQDSSAVLSNKPIENTLVFPDTGIDFEREAELWDIPGSDARRHPNSSRYAYDWRDPVMLFDFQKSIAPEKPLADLEYHYVHQPNVSEEYVRATFWHSYFHGLRLSNFWIWDKGQLGKAAGMQHVAWSQPRAAWATATTALDLRRLTRYVVAFPTRPEVGVYFSKPSLFLDSKPYRQALREVYEAANGLDAPVGFLTDKMIRVGRLKDFKLIVVSAAQHIEDDVLSRLQQYVSNGGRIVLVGRSFVYDENRKTRVAKFANINLKNAEQLNKDLDQAYATAGVNRALRLKTVDGQNGWPIEFRCATVATEPVCYILGLNKSPMTVEISGQLPSPEWKDLITGEEGTRPRFLIKPLEIRLLTFGSRSSK
jgi:hypothetical protein